MPDRLRNYPVLNKIKAGYSPTTNLRQDALGRRVYRVDEERQNMPKLAGQGGPGGLPQYRGPEGRTNDLLDAAKALGIPPQYATSPGIMQQVQQQGIAPQNMAKRYGTSNPRQQAIQLLRRNFGR